jgi:hypothetical protein
VLRRGLPSLEAITTKYDAWAAHAQAQQLTEDHALSLVTGTHWEGDSMAAYWLQKRPKGLRRTLVRLREVATSEPNSGFRLVRLNKLRRAQLRSVLEWDLGEEGEVVRGWLSSGWSPIHGVKVFTKIEPVTKAARCICPMAIQMNAILGPVCFKVEKVLSALPFLVKGMTVEERTVKLSELAERNHLFAETDFSAFDSTVALVHREVEWLQIKEFMNVQERLAYIILICCSLLEHSDLDPVFDKLAKLCIRSMRYSGESLTSIGNGLVNDYVGSSIEGGELAEALREGDDGFVGSPKPLDLTGHARKLGFNLETFWHADVRDVKFCGRYLSGESGDYISVCDLRRSLQKLHICTGAPSVKDPRGLLKAKLQSAWCLDMHTPVLSTIVWALWPHVAAQVAHYTRDDVYKLKSAGNTGAEPGLYPPVCRDSDFDSLLCQGICPAYARQYVRDVEIAAATGAALPLFDFGQSAVKVPTFAVTSI